MACMISEHYNVLKLEALGGRKHVGMRILPVHVDIEPKVLVIDEQTSCLGGLTDGMAAAFSLHCPELRRLEVSAKLFMPCQGLAARLCASLMASLMPLLYTAHPIMSCLLSNLLQSQSKKGLGSILFRDFTLVRFAKGPVIGLPAERFTDDGLIAFAKGCPHLQVGGVPFHVSSAVVLSLCNCAAITDRSMCAVAAHCRQLQAIMSDAQLAALASWQLHATWPTNPGANHSPKILRF
eukprot:scaffold124146_cov19-Tisochrysis_lutea.AAC.1